MRQVGGGQILGNYADFELEPGESIESVIECFQDKKIEIYCLDRSIIRVVYWVGGAWKPTPSVTQEERSLEARSIPGNCEQRLKENKPYTIIWSREPLAEIRFDEDGYVYIVEGLNYSHELPSGRS